MIVLVELQARKSMYLQDLVVVTDFIYVLIPTSKIAVVAESCRECETEQAVLYCLHCEVYLCESCMEAVSIYLNEMSWIEFI